MAREGAMLVMHGAVTRQEWPLGDETIIGREPQCDIPLPDRQVSRRHAVIRWTSAGYVIADAGSKNGTWLNGQAVSEPMLMTDGDELSIAAMYKLYYVDSDATAPLVFETRGLRLDPSAKRVFINGTLLDPPLTLPQYELLLALYEADGQTVTREAVVQRVWPYAEGAGVSDQALDALVRRLRQRLQAADPDQPYIITVRGYGYKLQAP